MSNDLEETRPHWFDEPGLLAGCSDEPKPRLSSTMDVKICQSSSQTDTSREFERRFGRHLLQSHEHDRGLIAYEIHDGMVQHITGAHMQLQALLATDNTMTECVRHEVEGCLELIQKSIEEARNLVRGLRPPVLDELGIVSALHQLIHELSPEKQSIDFDAAGQFDGLDRVLENSIYRITQEALANARRHSQSDRIVVRMTRTGSSIQLEIRDWGIGFNPSRVDADRYGLEGMRRRATFLGGTINITSDPGKGTRVFVELPIARAPGDRALESYGSNE